MERGAWPTDDTQLRWIYRSGPDVTDGPHSPAGTEAVCLHDSIRFLLVRIGSAVTKRCTLSRDRDTANSIRIASRIYCTFAGLETVH
jgi:hypothetical protein